MFAPSSLNMNRLTNIDFMIKSIFNFVNSYHFYHLINKVINWTQIYKIWTDFLISRVKPDRCLSLLTTESPKDTRRKGVLLRQRTLRVISAGTLITTKITLEYKWDVEELPSPAPDTVLLQLSSRSVNNSLLRSVSCKWIAVVFTL